MLTIREIQGTGLYSPYNGQAVSTEGVVTGVVRRGFFLQSVAVDWDEQRSDAVFVYSPKWSPERGNLLRVDGECVDFIKHETAKPVTQIRLSSAEILATDGPPVTAIEFTQRLLDLDNAKLAVLLNSLEGMLISIPAGQTFIAPSNHHGDYVLAMDEPTQDDSILRTEQGGAIVESGNPLRWFPGFRVANYNHAPRLNVGAKLRSEIVGPLNYRADAYQLAVNDPFKIEQSYIAAQQTSLVPSAGALTIMTLNCFNLDVQLEADSRVINPRRDIDDDWGEGRFHTLAQAVVLYAKLPDIVALQEIQDNDGAELSDVVDASATYAALIETIEQLSGLKYQWVDVAPKVGADGGQPGGNIRNAFLYNPERVDLVADSVSLIGQQMACFTGSRKPLVCEFIERQSQQRLTVINVHLASKRHQASIFAPHDAGIDAKQALRIEQAEAIRERCQQLEAAHKNYYLTGDFNDTEFSPTLQALETGGAHNLVIHELAERQRYDYNHRGKLQVLMHGLVNQRLLEQGAQYQIIHGNELIGVVPGEQSDKPSDHAYVIAKVEFEA